jgi:hypothetical protein
MIHYFKLRQSSLRLDNNLTKIFKFQNIILYYRYTPIDDFNSPFFSNILMVRITVSIRNPVKSPICCQVKSIEYPFISFEIKIYNE